MLLLYLHLPPVSTSRTPKTPKLPLQLPPSPLYPPQLFSLLSPLLSFRLCSPLFNNLSLVQPNLFSTKNNLARI